MRLPRSLDVLSSFLASAACLARGLSPAPRGPRPAAPLVLYEFEACPHCRRVREAVTALDLEVELRPCPKGGRRFRAELQARTGRAQFPYMEDPNTGAAMFESRDIVRYMYQHYGAGSAPWGVALPVGLNGLALASALRPGLGLRSRAQLDKAPAEPLILYGMEASPFTRLVRETLCELELPYLLRTTPSAVAPLKPEWEALKARLGLGTPEPYPGAKGSSERWKELKARAGKAMVPYLIDPNAGVEMYESADIMAYLEARYGPG